MEARMVMNAAASGEAAKQVLEFMGFRGRYTTVGAAAAEDFTLKGVKAGMVIFAFVNVEGVTPRTIVKADYQAADTVRVTFSGDPADDHEISILALPPA